MLEFYSDCTRMRQTQDGETLWRDLMARRRQIHIEEFESICDLSTFLDDGESLYEYIADDQETSFWKCDEWAIMQHAGFEFFFTKGFSST